MSLSENVDTDRRISADDLSSTMVVTRSCSAELRRQQKKEDGRERYGMQPTDSLLTYLEVRAADVVASREVYMSKPVQDPRANPQRFGGSNFASPVIFDGVSTYDYRLIVVIPWFSRTAV